MPYTLNWGTEELMAVRKIREAEQRFGVKVFYTFVFLQLFSTDLWWTEEMIYHKMMGEEE